MNQVEPDPAPSQGGPAEGDPAEGLSARIGAEAGRLAGESRERADAAKRLRALGAPRLLADFPKLEKALAKVEKALPPEKAEALGLAPVFAELRDYLKNAGRRLREKLSRELKAACEQRGKEFRVVSREDPVEVRIPPLLVRLDFAAGKAELLFAREPVAEVRAEAGAILDAHEKATKALEQGFDPDRFFDDCAAAVRAALAAAGRPADDRVEILDFLPYLALSRQSKQFRASPSPEKFKAYGKARFAYDVLRLRKAGRLSRHGLRLNFGVATGSTAMQKDRVVYFEDEHGDGEYKLTVYLTAAEERR